MSLCNDPKMADNRRIYIVITRRPKTEPCGTPDNKKDESHIKYHEQTLSETVVLDRIETIQVF